MSVPESTMYQITIALDAMGGDHGPKVIVPAALYILERYPNVRLILVGDQHILRKHVDSCSARENNRLVIHHASEVVAMDELPSIALRNKKDSSMRVTINLVKEDIAQACVSAGNTGALMATARFVLKMLPGIDRPAILADLPNRNGKVHVLDLGANIDCTAENLFQFAVMGSVLVSAVENISHPKIALLNIGQEEIKGSEAIKQAAQMLMDNPAINYIGYVEGDDIYMGNVDVVVCDGLLGNVALKASEGSAKLMKHFLKQSFHRTFLTRLIGFIAMSVLKRFGQQIDPARYNGASLLGLCGIVIKSHGSASISAYVNAIEKAMTEVQKSVPSRISKQVAEFLQKG